MNKLNAIFVILLISTFFNSCGMIAYGIKANTVAAITQGDKDVSKNKKYWKYIQRGSVLETVRRIRINKNVTKEYDFNAFPDADGKLSAGTRLTLNTVHYESNGYTWWNTDYIATVANGDFSGKTVRVNNLLQEANPSSNIMKLNSNILRIKRENKMLR